ncbi:MAG TPA: AraD1 family protein [Verrucomicrobiae bacterium]|nr:AraD1 family protein [Verrucomicrobiae bacterium]
MNRLVQIQNGANRRVALVEEPHLRLIGGVTSVYDLAVIADSKNTSLLKLVQDSATDERLDYNAIYDGKSPWKLMAPIDHPQEPARCLISGTGLTHLGSAKNRQAMHSASEAEMNDSMKIFKWGVEGGKPAPGKIGIAPEWFYKGNGGMLRGPGESLDVPSHAEDGGEEAEIAGVYFVAANGVPRRIGMAIGNEFSDHKFEKRNYLNLAGSKLRACALGPELVIDPEFQSVPGTVKIERGGKIIWSQEILTGEKEMCHSVANIEHHHFKFEGHRRPGDVHVHYFGACSLSFGAGIVLEHGDMMEVSFSGFGRPLRNPLRVAERNDRLVTVKPL